MLSNDGFSKPGAHALADQIRQTWKNNSPNVSVSIRVVVDDNNHGLFYVRSDMINGLPRRIFENWPPDEGVFSDIYRMSERKTKS